MLTPPEGVVLFAPSVLFVLFVPFVQRGITGIKLGETPQQFIGCITRWANTVVERVTLGIPRHCPDVSSHFVSTSVLGSVDPYPLGRDFDHRRATVRVPRDTRLDSLGYGCTAALNAGLSDKHPFSQVFAR